MVARVMSHSSSMSVASADVNSPAECGYASISLGPSLRRVRWVFVTSALFELELVLFVLVVTTQTTILCLLILICYGLIEILLAGR